MIHQTHQTTAGIFDSLAVISYLPYWRAFGTSPALLSMLFHTAAALPRLNPSPALPETLFRNALPHNPLFSIRTAWHTPRPETYASCGVRWTNIYQNADAAARSFAASPLVATNLCLAFRVDVLVHVWKRRRVDTMLILVEQSLFAL